MALVMERKWLMTGPGRSFTRLMCVLALVLAANGLLCPWYASASDWEGDLRAKPWAAAFEGRRYGTVFDEATCVDWAKRYDYLVAHPPLCKGHVDAMRAANPNVVLATYTNLVLIDMTQQGAYALPPSAFATDANGNFITAGDATYARLFNPLDEAVINYQIKNAKGRVAFSGYPDLYFDVASVAPFSPYMSGQPIDPRTHVTWKQQDWLEALAAAQRRIHDAVATLVGHDVKVVLNSLGNGPAYWANNLTTLRPGITASVCEGFLRANASSPVTAFPPERAWKQAVDMIVDAERRGYSVLAMTKVWSNPTVAQKQTWERFATASFLLGASGRSRLELSFAPGDTGTSYQSQAVGLGNPLSAYLKTPSGVYTRTFQKGMVLVNPTTMTLVASGRTLQPHTAIIETQATTT